MKFLVDAQLPFDSEEENRVFEDQDDSSYMALQPECMDLPARKGASRRDDIIDRFASCGPNKTRVSS